MWRTRVRFRMDPGLPEQPPMPPWVPFPPIGTHFELLLVIRTPTRFTFWCRWFPPGSGPLGVIFVFTWLLWYRPPVQGYFSPAGERDWL